MTSWQARAVNEDSAIAIDDEGVTASTPIPQPTAPTMAHVALPPACRRSTSRRRSSRVARRDTDPGRADRGVARRRADARGADVADRPGHGRRLALVDDEEDGSPRRDAAAHGDTVPRRANGTANELRRDRTASGASSSRGLRRQRRGPGAHLSQGDRPGPAAQRRARGRDRAGDRGGERGGRPVGRARARPWQAGGPPEDVLDAGSAVAEHAGWSARGRRRRTS